VDLLRAFDLPRRSRFRPALVDAATQGNRLFCRNRSCKERILEAPNLHGALARDAARFGFACLS
jgi:hypothetical protein